MKFSVIIPAYRCADTIESTVQSILNSGIDDFEILIVDDGSDDETPQICRNLAQTYAQVKYIKKQNGGVSSARNRGIDESSGEYLLFCDADDLYDSHQLNGVFEQIKNSKADLLIFGLSFDYYNNGTIYRSDKMCYPHDGACPPENWTAHFREMFSYNALSSACTKIFNAKVIKDNNIRFNESAFLMEDFLFVLDYLQYTKNIFFLPRTVYRYRQPQNETHAYTRLGRISNLNEYLVPFYTSTETLKKAVKTNFNLDFQQADDVMFDLYTILIAQKSFYADTVALKEIAETVKTGKWANRTDTDVLLNDLKNGKFLKIVIRHKKIRLRHKMAVTVKKSRIFQKLRKQP